MENRHAYLIMAHHRPDLLQALLDAIDDSRNDIFVHIDKKSVMKPEDFKVKRASLAFIKRININWAGYSQVECEYRLLEAAVTSGKHSYYHFLSGVSYPLWNQEFLHAFFDKNTKYEYIGFDNLLDYSDRARYYYFFSEYGKLKGLLGKGIFFWRKLLLFIQKRIGVDRIASTDFIIKKGCAYWSITDGFARYVLTCESMIKSMLKYTMYGDEVFVQTLAYNSIYRKDLFNIDNEYDGAMREVPWSSNIQGEHPECNLNMNDLEYLLSSKRLFALKFESSDGCKLINNICLERNI